MDDVDKLIEGAEQVFDTKASDMQGIQALALGSIAQSLVALAKMEREKMNYYTHQTGIVTNFPTNLTGTDIPQTNTNPTQEEES